MSGGALTTLGVNIVGLNAPLSAFLRFGWGEWVRGWVVTVPYRYVLYSFFSLLEVQRNTSKREGARY